MTLDHEDIAAIADAVAARLIDKQVSAGDLTDLKPWEMDAESRKKHFKALREQEKKGGRK